MRTLSAGLMPIGRLETADSRGVSRLLACLKRAHIELPALANTALEGLEHVLPAMRIELESGQRGPPLAVLAPRRSRKTKRDDLGLLLAHASRNAPAELCSLAYRFRIDRLRRVQDRVRAVLAFVGTRNRGLACTPQRPGSPLKP